VLDACRHLPVCVCGWVWVYGALGSSRREAPERSRTLEQTKLQKEGQVSLADWRQRWHARLEARAPRDSLDRVGRIGEKVPREIVRGCVSWCCLPAVHLDAASAAEARARILTQCVCVVVGLLLTGSRSSWRAGWEAL
jgi:hypothetical protein